MLMTPYDILLNDLVAEGKIISIMYSHDEAYEKLRKLSNYEQDFGYDAKAWKAWLMETDPLYRRWRELEEEYDEDE